MDKRFTTKTVHEINCDDLNKLIAETYGLDNFEGTFESPNDSTYAYTVEKSDNQYRHSTEENRALLISYDHEEVFEAINRKGCEHYSLGYVLNDMCDRGIIEEGDYLVSVCW